MKLRIGFLILFFMEDTFGFFKRWMPNTNFDTPLNWNTGKIPCGNDEVHIPDDSPAIMMNSSSTIGQLFLPHDGVLVLGKDNTLLGFTSQSDNPHCINSGQTVQFNATYAREWVDPANWCVAETINGPCLKNIALLDSEKIPCNNDDVIFPSGNSYFIDFGTDMELTINTMRFFGKTYSTNSFKQFIKSVKGREFFKLYKSDQSPTQLNIKRRPCRDPASCECGNYKPPILKKICQMHAIFCKRPQCKQPVRPTGHCCNICGAVIKSKFENGFNYNSLVSSLKREFIPNETQVELMVSRIGTSIQLTLTDPIGNRSGTIAQKIFQDINNDIKEGSRKYIFSGVEIKISGASRTKMSTKPPLLSSTSEFQTTTEEQRTSVVAAITTTPEVIKGPTKKGHLKSVNSSSSTPTDSGLTDIRIMEIIFGGLALQVLIIVVIVLYKRGKISSFVDHVRRNPVVVDFHKRFVNQDSVPMEDLPNQTLDDCGFQNPMYGTRTHQSGKLDYLTNDDNDIGEARSNERGFDNPLFGSNMNQETLFDDASKISPSLKMNPVYDPNELQDSTI